MLSSNLEKTLQLAVNIAQEKKHQSASIEHLAVALLNDKDIKAFLSDVGANAEDIKKDLEKCMEEHHEAIDKRGSHYEIAPSISFQKVVHKAAIQANLSGICSEINAMNILAEILSEPSSQVSIIFNKYNISRLAVVNYLVHGNNVMFAAGNETVKKGSVYNSMSPQEIFERFTESNNEKKDSASAIEKYCVNLNQSALEGKIDVLVGREEETNRLIEILSRRTKNNPLLIGEPGVGKTIIVEGLAYKLAKNEVPPAMKGAIIFSLDLGSILAGTRYRGDFEERMKKILKELAEIKGAVLFIDEIHNIIGAGSTNGGALDASNLLKPALARGEIKCIGSTSFNEYSKHFAKDKSLIRRFQQVTVNEPSVEATIQILKGLQKYYEKYHSVQYTDEALISAVELSKRYIHDKQLPDKAVDIIDETGAFLAVHNANNKVIKVTSKEIEETVAKMAKIPVASVTKSEAERLKSLDKVLKKNIYGQSHAIDALCASVKLSRAGLRNTAKPIGCYLFSGPTGVGKTELAIQLAKQLNMHFIRFDMSEYMEQHSVSKLIGTPPGYVGFDTGGQLTEEVAKSPYSVLLLDEIEKAHFDLYNILLQVMDYGTLTDHQGKKVSFQNTIIIMTTNAGAKEMSKSAVGFDRIANDTLSDFKIEIERTFSPEFRNRLDGVIPFLKLTEDTIKKVANKFIEELEEQLKAKNVSIKISDKAFSYICKNGYNEQTGARVMDKIINEKIKTHIANEILFGKLTKGGKIAVDIKEGELVFNFSSAKEEKSASSKTPEKQTCS